MNSRQYSAGFTIVELLIVIVVIGVLAAISVVAFTGIQDRAQNNVRIQAAHQIAKAYEAAVLQHGVNLGQTAPYCLPIGLPDDNGDGTPECGIVSAAGTYDRVEKATSITMLRNAGLTNLNFPTSEITGSDGRKYRGIQVTYGSGTYGVDGILQPYFLYFFLKGSAQDCSSSYSIGGNPGNDNTNNPLFAYRKATRYGSSNGVTTCAYTIKHPSSI